MNGLDGTRVVVAGGAGFIGSHLCEALLEQGASVLCVDNMSTGQDGNVAPLFTHPRFEFLHADVEELPDLPAAAYLHLASPASPRDYDVLWLETMTVNSAGTRRLLEMAERHGARFVLASTSEVYGEPWVHPQTEDYQGNVNPVGPRACYDESKRFAEAMTMAFHRKRGVDARIVRIFNTYGPRMRAGDGRAIPAFITAARAGKPLVIYGDGQQTRSFCYVTDLVEGLLEVLLDDDGAGLVCNIGNPQEVSVLELAELVAELCGAPVAFDHAPLPADDPTRRRPDIERMRTRYGWEPQVSLADGLQRTIRALGA